MKPAAGSNVLLSERRGPIGTLTFNRPEQRNALSPQLLERFCEVLAQWAASGEIRVVIVTGAGDKAFSAGYDIRAIETVGPAGTAPRGGDKVGTPFDRALAAIKHFPFPTIAMINGHCFGGALHLALCCDLRIAADHISIGMPPAKLGIVYGAEGLLQFIQVLGSARARELFFTGRTYRGRQLQDLGLVDHWVPATELGEHTFAMAEDISRNAPLALRGIKRIMNLVEAPVLSADVRAEAARLVAESFRSADLKEGQTAFIEKREPRFSGR